MQMSESEPAVETNARALSYAVADVDLRRLSIDYTVTGPDRLSASLHRLAVADAAEVGGASLDRALALSSLQSRTALDGAPLWLIRVVQGDETAGWALGSIERGKLRATLTITIVGAVPAGASFWPLLERIGHRLGATSIQVEVVTDSPGHSVPALPGETSRHSDIPLFVVELEGCGDLSARFSKNTKRNIARAIKAGAAVSAKTSPEALSEHLRLTGASMDRRARRGESVTLRASIGRLERYLKAGDATLYQAAIEGETTSSDFVFRLGGSAFYYDGGSSTHGMQEGTSHFLMSRLLESLGREGVQSVNLGIARKGNEGLARFKTGFGARVWHIERVLVDRRSTVRVARNLARFALSQVRP